MTAAHKLAPPSTSQMLTRSTVTIDLAAVRHNVKTLAAIAHPAELWAVVKADGYGHGATQVAKAALTAGATALCVATPAEAMMLRELVSDARIIVLGPTPPAEYQAVQAASAELVVGAGPIPDSVPVHLKVDTGMGRAGVQPSDVPDALPSGVVGIMTHLAVADDATQDAFTADQLARFERVTERFPGLSRHVANTAATLRFGRARYEAVRCGIGIYGLSPFADRSAGFDLRPALTWQCRVSEIKTLQPGESTGYGRRFVADEPTRVGLVPVGYADGFPRTVHDAHVIVNGDVCQVVGTPSMDSFAIRLPASVEVGAAVTIVGEGVSAEQQAAAAGTLNYELVCSVGRNPVRCERRFVNG